MGGRLKCGLTTAFFQGFYMIIKSLLKHVHKQKIYHCWIHDHEEEIKVLNDLAFQ